MTEEQLAKVREARYSEDSLTRLENIALHEQSVLMHDLLAINVIGLIAEIRALKKELAISDLCCPRCGKL